MSLVPASRHLARRSALSASQVFKRWISVQQLNDQQADRTRLVVLGSGWGGFSLLQNLSIRQFQPVVISPRPYFVFTPLLASTSVGTLEPRTALEGVRTPKGVEYYEASVSSIDFDKKEVKCISPLHGWDESQAFSIKYDKLVIAVGSHTQTFGIPGVQEHAYFLKETRDAIKIRRRILHCFEEASLPSTSEARRKQLLHFCIVGGGPTGVEFSAELHDLIHDDLSKKYPSLLTNVRISLYDVAPRILSMFDSALAQYATEHFARQHIEVRTRRTVTRVEDGVLHVKEEGEVPFGMLVWSTGVEMTPLIKTLQGVRKDPKGGRIVTDGWLRVIEDTTAEEGKAPKLVKDVYALGDCAVIDGTELPLTAQVAAQKGVWMRKWLELLVQKGLNKPAPALLQAKTPDTISKTPNAASPVEAKPVQDTKTAPTAVSEQTKPQQFTQKEKAITTPKDLEASVGAPFKYRNYGVLAYLGEWKAIGQAQGRWELKGWLAWILWRTAYLTKTISWRNKLRIPLLWAINYFFGRDITHL